MVSFYRNRTRWVSKDEYRLILGDPSRGVLHLRCAPQLLSGPWVAPTLEVGFGVFVPFVQFLAVCFKKPLSIKDLRNCIAVRRLGAAKPCWTGIYGR
jgi:hypothetical protein